MFSLNKITHLKTNSVLRHFTVDYLHLKRTFTSSQRVYSSPTVDTLEMKVDLCAWLRTQNNSYQQTLVQHVGEAAGSDPDVKHVKIWNWWRRPIEASGPRSGDSYGSWWDDENFYRVFPLCRDILPYILYLDRIYQYVLPCRKIIPRLFCEFFMLHY